MAIIGYAVRNLLPADKWRKRNSGLLNSYIVFGEDECGNEFLVDGKDRVHFWDHETDVFTQICGSILVFLESLTEAPEVVLKPGQVKSVWIDPAFKAKLDKQKGN